jgi:hypothetical protein
VPLASKFDKIVNAAPISARRRLAVAVSCCQCMIFQQILNHLGL